MALLIRTHPNTKLNNDYTADQWMLVMSTQLLGFSIGGILRRFLVQPPSMSEHLASWERFQSRTPFPQSGQPIS